MMRRQGLVVAMFNNHVVINVTNDGVVRLRSVTTISRQLADTVLESLTFSSTAAHKGPYNMVFSVTVQVHSYNRIIKRNVLINVAIHFFKDDEETRARCYDVQLPCYYQCHERWSCSYCVLL